MVRLTWILLVSACAMLGTAGRSQAADVPWLAEVTAPPSAVPQPDRPLSPVVVGANHMAITTLTDWEPARRALKQAWLDFLGPLPVPPERMPLTVLNTEILEHCRRSLVRYEAEPGRVVNAFLLQPHGEAQIRRPGMVVFHSTTAETIKAVAGTGSKPEQAIGLRLAERGFVVLCPENFLWEEPAYQAAVDAAKRRHPTSRGMATMLADGLRAVDILTSLPEVDPQRIGTMGHSLGAKEALYLLAFDERVKAGVASEGGIGLTFTNWDAPWYLGPEIREPGFSRDHHELLALIAPRPFLVLGGETGPGCADGDRTWPYIAVGQSVARLSGEPVRIGLLNHHQGHRLSPEIAERAFEWLDCSLAAAARE